MGSGLVFIFLVNIIIWFGIIFYLFRIDRKIGELEKRVKSQIDEK